ncbi:MAG: thioredoxin [Xanthomonadales bacterium]|nr:thioredoxin [Xanthomonadales bacterium]MCB1633409.1 thioredoxin [Xanthomonadales bacterium]
MNPSPHIFVATQDNFEAEVMEASFDTPVLVDFWAPWCGPCKMLMPLLEKVVNEANGQVRLAKVNTDEEMAIAGSFGIRSLPTVVLFKDGRPVDGFMGAQPEGAIRALLAKHMPPLDAEPVEDDEAAPDLDLEQALAEAQAKVQAEPDNEAAKAELADLLIQAGLLEDAQALLQGLSDAARGEEAAQRAQSRLGFAQIAADAGSEAELQARLHDDAGDLDARHKLGALYLAVGQDKAALDQFITILRSDRKFGDDLGRKSLVEAFRIVRDADLVGDYRRQMSSLLF